MSATWFVRLVSWSGAIAFALSLALFGYAYAVLFDVVAPPARPWWPAAGVNLLLFSVFALHHSLLARTGLKRRVLRVVGPALERPLYVWLSSLLFAACCWWWQPLPGVWYAWPEGGRPVALGVQGLGLVVTLVAVRRLDAQALAGLRREHPDAPPRPLETSGLYGLVRHPIYFGWILFVLGAPVMTATRGLFALVSIAYLVAAVPFEERGLIAVYGERYRAYQRQVRARLVPGVF